MANKLNVGKDEAHLAAMTAYHRLLEAQASGTLVDEQALRAARSVYRDEKVRKYHRDRKRAERGTVEATPHA